MENPNRWYSMLVALLILGVAACGDNGQKNHSQLDSTATAPVAPKTITVAVAANGDFSPNPIAPNPGDTVSFRADSVDVVLCVDPGSLFGEERYEIAGGQSLDLTVQPEAIHIPFSYVAIVGDLMAECGGIKGVGSGDGSGKTGP